MKKIFELFYRSESELTQQTVGTGIGLAIVYQLTTAMGVALTWSMLIPAQSFESSTRRCHSHRSTDWARHGKTPYCPRPP
jgi:hypothetical protein